LVGHANTRQRVFLIEKVLGSNDRDAALIVGDSLSIAENAKQALWSKPGMREEVELLKARIDPINSDAVLELARKFDSNIEAALKLSRSAE